MKSLVCLSAFWTCGAVHTQGACGPTTKVFMPADESASAWIQKTFTPGECMTIGRYDVKKVKICGPGTFSFSAMTCNNHEYKAEVIEVSKSENTGECSVQDLATLPDGYMGSYTVTC